MKRTLIQNAVVINEGRKVLGSVVIENEKIAEILVGEENATAPCDEIIDAVSYTHLDVYKRQTFKLALSN